MERNLISLSRKFKDSKSEYKEPTVRIQMGLKRRNLRSLLYELK
jgi:hypothetical protein